VSAFDTAVIVPTMRPANAELFMASLKASTEMAKVYAVTDAETAPAWRAAGAEVLVGDEVSFAQRVNAGYRATDEPWLFIVGDDVKFHRHWLINAKLIASRRYHVVGTADLANPRVMSGDHATHLLIRRSYIDEVGASWDGPKAVCHEGYRHWFVDDEIVTAAQRRGVWAFARSSVVEHLHPLTGKADWDEVYEIGVAHKDADEARFRSRLREHLG
jgi:hypothetical protein